jgi:hypothetical protein
MSRDPPHQDVGPCRYFSVPHVTPRIVRDLITPTLLSRREAHVQTVRRAVEAHLIPDLASLVLAFDQDMPDTLVHIETGLYTRNVIVPLWNEWCIKHRVTNLRFKKKEACTLMAVLEWIQRTHVCNAHVAISDFTHSGNQIKADADAEQTLLATIEAEARGRALSIDIFTAHYPTYTVTRRVKNKTSPCACACCSDPSVPVGRRRGAWSFVLPRKTIQRRRIRLSEPLPFPLLDDANDMAGLLALAGIAT